MSEQSLPSEHDDNHDTAKKLSFRWQWRLAIRDDTSLSWRAKHIGNAVEMHMDGNGGSCFPKRKTLAAECGVSTDTVDKGIAELVEGKRLHVHRGGTKLKNGKYAVNRYTALIDGFAANGDDLWAADSGLVGAADSDPRLSRSLDRHKTKDKVKTIAGIGCRQDDPNTTVTPPDDPPETPVDTEERMLVVRFMERVLLPVLEVLHWEKDIPWDGKSTGTTLARVIQTNPLLHEGHIAYMADRFTGNMPDGRYSAYDVDKIENPSGYACTVLRKRRFQQRDLSGYYEEMQGVCFVVRPTTRRRRKA